VLSLLPIGAHARDEPAIEIVNTIFIIREHKHVVLWVSLVVEVVSSNVVPTDTARGVGVSIHHPREAFAVL